MNGSRKTSLGYITVSEENGCIVGLSFNDDGNNGKGAALDDAFVQLEEYLSKERKSFELKYRFTGTDFQKKVWNTLLKIPYGKTVSYSEEATMMGNANAYRAVGSANGKNPIPIFVPCHRVICSDGTLGGYSSGLKIKKKLLELEGVEWITERR